MEDAPVKTSSMSEQRAPLLRAAVGFALVPPSEPELQLLHGWLDSWRGIGDVVRGMARQGWDVQTHGIRRRTLARPSSSPVRRTQSSADQPGRPTPGRAVQRAAWETLAKAEAR